MEEECKYCHGKGWYTTIVGYLRDCHECDEMKEDNDLDRHSRT